MDRRRLANMSEATRLVREGRLGEAAALLQGGATGLRGATHLADLLARFPSSKGQTPAWHTPREPGPPLPGRWLRGSYVNAAGAREYRLYVPSCYAGQRLPMIVMLHGGTQSAEDFA